MATDFSNKGPFWHEYIPSKCGLCSHCETNETSPFSNVGTCDLLDRNVDKTDKHENCPLDDEEATDATDNS